MKPLIIYGSTDKARQNFAEKMAEENECGFVTVEAKKFELYSRSYITSGLDGKKTLFFFYDVETLTVEQSTKLVSLIKNSGHLFLLSIPFFTDINFVLKKNCVVKNLGNVISDLNLALKNIMTLNNRDAVKVSLDVVEPIFLFHILKKEAWQKPECLTVLMNINQYIYKVKKDYIASMLAYCFPKKAYVTNFRTKKNDLSVMKKIKIKLAKTYKLNPNEAADLYQLILFTKEEPVKALLTQTEKEYMRLYKKLEQKNVVKTKSSLDAYF